MSEIRSRALNRVATTLRISVRRYANVDARHPAQERPDPGRFRVSLRTPNANPNTEFTGDNRAITEIAPLLPGGTQFGIRICHTFVSVLNSVLAPQVAKR